AGEARATTDEVDADRGYREQVRAHCHRADDEDDVAVGDPIAGDDPRYEHECEVAPYRPGVDPRLSKDVGPDEGRLRRAAGGPFEELEPVDHRVLGGDSEPL